MLFFPFILINATSSLFIAYFYDKHRKRFCLARPGMC